MEFKACLSSGGYCFLTIRTQKHEAEYSTFSKPCLVPHPALGGAYETFSEFIFLTVRCSCVTVK